MRSFNLFLLFVLLILLFGYFTLFRRHAYPLYAVIDNVHSVESESKVILDGKEIGRIDKVRMLGMHRVLLKLSIDDGVKIPGSDDVRYRETLLGGAEVDISGAARKVTESGVAAKPGMLDRSGFLKASDTLHGMYEPNFKEVDSNDRKRILNRLDDLVKTVDSVAKKKK